MRKDITYFIPLILLLLIPSFVLISSAETTGILNLTIHEVQIFDTHDDPRIFPKADLYIEIAKDSHIIYRYPDEGLQKLDVGEIWSIDEQFQIDMDKFENVTIQIWDDDTEYATNRKRDDLGTVIVIYGSENIEYKSAISSTPGDAEVVYSTAYQNSIGDEPTKIPSDNSLISKQVILQSDLSWKSSSEVGLISNWMSNDYDTSGWDNTVSSELELANITKPTNLGFKDGTQWIWDKNNLDVILPKLIYFKQVFNLDSDQTHHVKLDLLASNGYIVIINSVIVAADASINLKSDEISANAIDISAAIEEGTNYLTIVVGHLGDNIAGGPKGLIAEISSKVITNVEGYSIFWVQKKHEQTYSITSMDITLGASIQALVVVEYPSFLYRGQMGTINMELMTGYSHFYAKIQVYIPKFDQNIGVLIQSSRGMFETYTKSIPLFERTIIPKISNILNTELVFSVYLDVISSLSLSTTINISDLSVTEPITFHDFKNSNPIAFKSEEAGNIPINAIRTSFKLDFDIQLTFALSGIINEEKPIDLGDIDVPTISIENREVGSIEVDSKSIDEVQNLNGGHNQSPVSIQLFSGIMGLALMMIAFKMYKSKKIDNM